MKRRIKRQAQRVGVLLRILAATWFLINIPTLSVAFPAELTERPLPSIQSATPGFASMVKGVTPAVVNILSRAARPSERREILRAGRTRRPFGSAISRRRHRIRRHHLA